MKAINIFIFNFNNYVFKKLNYNFCFIYLLQIINKINFM